MKHVAALSQDELAEFEEKLSENYARRSMGVQQCPGCQSFCMKINKADTVVRCPVCSANLKRSYDFCWSCLNPSSSSKCQHPECDGCDPRLRYLKSFPLKEIVGVRAITCMTCVYHCSVLQLELGIKYSTAKY